MHELVAPPAWRSIDFISDLHLQAAEPATFDAWRRFMAGCTADALFILGDLFELWVGDDDAQGPGFPNDCGQVLQEASRRRPVFFMHGNRDFLVGSAFLDACGVTLLPDPTVLTFGGKRWLLTHGDMLCLDDTEYLRFRAQVRDAQWQQRFLAQPLAERKTYARNLRERSQARKDAGLPYGDVDAEAAAGWLRAADAGVMIHGHTHRPGEHALPGGGTRIVLSDWDAGAQPPRLQALRLDGQGWRRVPAG
jgi:UDP-2,3-diacylglucosamine hydrolase